MVDPSDQLPTTTILVVFQQRAVANWIGDCLREDGYVVAVAKGYDDALRTLCIIEPDAAVVSASKLDGDTEAFLGWLDRDPRARGIPTILVAPSKSQAVLADIAAHRSPRNGYLSWPLKCRDLRLVMQDLLRSDRQVTEPISGRRLVLDRQLRVLRGRAGTTFLTPAECRLAEHLISQRGRPVAVDDLLTCVFGLYPGNGNPALVRAHLASLRQKMMIITGGGELIRAVGKNKWLYLGR